MHRLPINIDIESIFSACYHQDSESKEDDCNIEHWMFGIEQYWNNNIFVLIRIHIYNHFIVIHIFIKFT